MSTCKLLDSQFDFKPTSLHSRGALERGYWWWLYNKIDSLEFSGPVKIICKDGVYI